MKTFDPSKQVKVYFEFDTGMLTLEQNGERLYIDRIGLCDAELIIDQRLKKQMMLTGKRIVHAWAWGYITPIDRSENLKPIRYIPQKHEGWHFEDKPEKIITHAQRLYVNDRRAYIPPASTIKYKK